MLASLTIVPVTLVAFLATNLDNFTLLVALLAQHRSNRLTVLLAYVATMLIAIGLAYFAGRTADFLPVEYLGFLGVIPLTLGIVGLAKLAMRPPGDSQHMASNVTANRAVFVTALLTQLGNCADTIVTFGALFADSNPSSDVLIVSTAVLLALLFAVASVYTLGQPVVARLADRHAHRVTPLLLIAIGFYILLNTATDVLPEPEVSTESRWSPVSAAR